MNQTGADLNPDDDPLSTVDPLATFDPDMTIDRAHDATDLGTAIEPFPVAPAADAELTLAEDEQSQISEICSEFESAWKSDEGEPSVEEFVPEEMDPGLRQMLVRELVMMDIDYRKQKSKSLDTTEYLSKLPGCEQAIESAFSKRKATLPRGYGSVTPPQTTRRGGTSGGLPTRSHDPTSRYRATHFHARGGLGAVFRARDEELKRLVALKEILPDHSANVKCQDRFVFEAEVTGSLEHPGIVPIYGLGRYQDQRPYYAMRFIRGRSFRDVIEEFHKANPTPSAGCYFGREFRMLLRRLMEACNAIHYAHEHGVLHRDIKPDNIMLGKYGETLVVDWGLAKLINAARNHVSESLDSVKIEVSGSGTNTSQGSAVGTPMYMSPEQALGLHDQLDGRTDVYSLGAMLFNIVTGQHPIEGKSGREIVMNVRDGKTKRVDDVAAHAPKALGSICRKAMAPRPEDRYASAVELADDLDRWMSDEVVQAHLGHEGVLERAGRLIRRYRSWTLSGAAALLVITLVAVLSAILISNAKRKEQLAKQEAIVSKKDAVDRYRDSREAIDTWLVQSSDALEYFPGTQSVRQRLLNLATEDYRQLASKVSRDPELELERGRAMVKLGDLLRRQEEHQRAIERYNEAIALFDEHSADEILGSRFRVERANVHTKLGLAFAGLDQLDQAEREFEIAIEALTGLADASADQDAQLLLAVAHVNAGELDWIVGRTEAAQRQLAAALARYGRLPADDDAQRDLGVAKTHQLIGQIAADSGNHDEAIAEFDLAIADLTRLVDADPDQPEYLELLAAVQISKAASYRTQGLEIDLFAALRSAVDSYRALGEAMPNVPRYDENHALSLTDLGIAFHEASNNAEAEAVLTDAQEQFSDLVNSYGQVPRFRQRLAVCEDALGQLLLETSESADDAATLLDNATLRYGDLLARSRSGVGGPESQDPEQLANSRIEYVEGLAVAQSHYAQALTRLGDPDQAQQYFAAAIDLLQTVIKARDQASFQNALAHVHYRFGLFLFGSDEEETARQQFIDARDRWIAIGADRAASYSDDLAWMLAICPDPTIRDPQTAQKYAAEATGLAPENPRFLTTAALSAVLADEDPATVAATLEKVRAIRGYWIDRDFFVLALAEHATGKEEQADQTLAAGIAWMDENRPHSIDSQLLRELVQSTLSD